MVEDGKRRKVIVCHDLMGNYRNDRFVDHLSEDYSDYRFYHWFVSSIFKIFVLFKCSIIDDKDDHLHYQ